MSQTVIKLNVMNKKVMRLKCQSSKSCKCCYCSCPLNWFPAVKKMLSHADLAGCVVVLFAGAVAEGDGGRDHRRRSGGEPGSCDHRSRGQRDGDHPLEPDAGHSEETCVHVAPPAQDLVPSALLHTRPVSSSNTRFFIVPPLMWCPARICVGR